MVASPVSLSDRVLGIDGLQNPEFVPHIHAQNESWLSSLKANLVYAFNAVAKAAGGHGGGGLRMVSEEGEDKLTRLPVRSVCLRRGNRVGRILEWGVGQEDSRDGYEVGEGGVGGD
ncbi:hypothetical protein GYMLUDRAFT_244266 [Collybiopsis luxurians FD-317 M1]|uniref:Uncharacterized protein n=1 Tax=Collybiopsis luxurians FD-317 M1 TaxID=944289 RepID=A0A0D0CPB1_9AGAR|nr:hypothetical protein GYMLUDRAFT_244266 [Collybiopsis luxurians FD-317 M1]